MSATTTKPPCPNPECFAPHVVRNGTLGGRQRYHCKGCGACFGQTHGTPMYRLHTSPEEVGRALLVVMRRGSLRAA
jgi:transposase-like protein